MNAHTRNIVVLGVLESTVMLGMMARLVMGPGLDFSHQPTLLWFLGVSMLGSGSFALYVVRASRLLPRARAGERVDEELTQVLAVSVALLGLAGLAAAAGPSLVEWFRP